MLYRHVPWKDSDIGSGFSSYMDLYTESTVPLSGSRLTHNYI